jgi:hypothetical protein
MSSATSEHLDYFTPDSSVGTMTGIGTWCSFPCRGSGSCTEIYSDSQCLLQHPKTWIILHRIAQSVQWLGYGLSDRCSFPCRGNNVIFSLRNRIHTVSKFYSGSYWMVPDAPSPKVKRRGVNLTTHLHLSPRLRMGGTKPQLPQYVFISKTFVFMVWCLVKHRDNFIFTLHVNSTWDSSISIVTRLRAGRPGINHRQGQGKDFFFFATVSTPAL